MLLKVEAQGYERKPKYKIIGLIFFISSSNVFDVKVRHQLAVENGLTEDF